MYRVIAIAGGALALAACSSFNLDALKPAPPMVTVRFESDPPGAEVKVSNGQTCRTPCALALEANTGYTATFTLNGYQPDEETIEVAAAPDNTMQLRPTRSWCNSPPLRRRPSRRNRCARRNRPRPQRQSRPLPPHRRRRPSRPPRLRRRPRNPRPRCRRPGRQSSRNRRVRAAPYRIASLPFRYHHREDPRGVTKPSRPSRSRKIVGAACLPAPAGRLWTRSRRSVTVAI